MSKRALVRAAGYIAEHGPEVMTSGQSQTQGCGAMFFVELINERLMKNILSLSRI